MLVSLLSGIDPERFSVTLLLINHTGVFLKQIPEHIEVIGMYDRPRTPLYRLQTHFYPVRNFLRHRRARRLLEGRSFDVTVAFMEGAPSRLHQQLFDLSPRNLAWVHTDLKRGRWYDFWFRIGDERSYYSGLDAIAFVSEDARKAFRDVFSTDARLAVILNPVDTARIRAMAGERGERGESAEQGESLQRENPAAEGRTLKIVNVGRLVPPKNHRRLIEAARILKGHGVDFDIRIFGSGPLEAELKELAAGYGLEGKVNFEGFSENPFPAVAASDLFLLTSDYEGFGMVVAEALTLGVPVVSTPVTGVKEMLAHGGGILTGFDPEGIAEAVERIAESPALLAGLREEAGKASSQFDLKAIISQAEDFIG